MTDIGTGALTLISGPLMAVVCCVACLRLYFYCFFRCLRADDDADKSSDVQDQKCCKPKRTQTVPIDLGTMGNEEEKCKDIIRKTSVEKMMDHFQFGVCVEVDGHRTAENFTDSIENIETIDLEQPSAPREQRPQDEGLPNADSTHGDCCAICLERYEVGDILCTGKTDNCSHVFHKDCMVQWIRRRNRCPVCRTNLMNQQGEVSIYTV